MRTFLPRSTCWQFSGFCKNPVSDHLLNNPDELHKGYRVDCNQDLSFHFSKIVGFGMQRFSNGLNLAYQILSLSYLKKFSLTISNCYIIITC